LTEQLLEANLGALSLLEADVSGKGDGKNVLESVGNAVGDRSCIKLYYIA
jgi:hypothetical protein